MRNMVFCLVLLFGLIVSGSWDCHAAGSSSHIFINGRITFLSSSDIVVAGVPCHLAKKVRVIVRDKKNDSFYEYPVTLSSLSTGSAVTVRVDGNVVDEIIIERWSR
jgi:hypothetical protein